jgi:hypothetical protein
LLNVELPNATMAIVKKLPISLATASLLLTLGPNAPAQSTPPPLAPPTSPSQISPSTAPGPSPATPLAVTPVAPPAPPPARALVPPGPPSAPPGPAAPTSARLALMSLRLMREKGVISNAEYESALKDLQETTGAQTASQASVVFGRWATTVYGFLAADMILDSTRSLTEAPGGTLIALGGTPAGDNARMTMSVRYTRLGFRMKAPQVGQVMTSATLESDFLGNQPAVQTGPYPGAPVPTSPYTSESAYFTNPTFRIRHADFKVETPVVDVLFGQYWQLFGWGPGYQPNSLTVAGMPGEINSRTPQLRVSKLIKGPINFEFAVAATRPFQRDSATPDGEAGLRFSVDSWKGTQTIAATGTQTAPLSVAMTGLLRNVAVNEFTSGTSKYTNKLTMTALALDAFVPIVPGTGAKRDNSLSLQGEFATGFGYADMYQNTTFGIGFPTPAGAGFATTATSVKATYYSPDIDPGVVTYDAAGKLHAIELTSYIFGAQYYLPDVDGKLWISGNYSHQESANSHFYTNGSPTSVLAAIDWFDVNLFTDPLPGIRFGLEYANTRDTYVNGVFAINHRGQLSGFFVF